MQPSNLGQRGKGDLKITVDIHIFEVGLNGNKICLSVFQVRVVTSNFGDAKMHGK